MAPISLASHTAPSERSKLSPENSNSSQPISHVQQCRRRLAHLLVDTLHNGHQHGSTRPPYDVFVTPEIVPYRIFVSRKHEFRTSTVLHLPQSRRKHNNPAGAEWHFRSDNVDDDHREDSIDFDKVDSLRYSHASLQISGWLGKRGQRIGSRVWRFFTLRGSILSNSHGEGAPPTWSISMRGASVSASGTRKVVVVQRGITFSLLASSGAARSRWVAALRTVASPLFTFYDKGKLIGGCDRSEVFLGRDKVRNELCVIKVLSRRRDDRTMFVARQPTTLFALSHPRIVQTYDVFDAHSKTQVVMEYLPGGDLLDRITEHGRLSEQSARVAIRDVLLALRYLHNQGIMHRDVALEHILCVSWTPPLRVKLVGFGLSHATLSFSESSVYGAHMQRGSAYYMSPETADGADPAPPADLWACGVVLYVMLAGKLPFYGETDEKFMRRLHQGAQFPDEEWSAVSVSAKDLVRGLLDPCVDTRLTANQALQRRWLLIENDEDFTEH